MRANNIKITSKLASFPISVTKNESQSIEISYT